MTAEPVTSPVRVTKMRVKKHKKIIISWLIMNLKFKERQLRRELKISKRNLEESKRLKIRRTLRNEVLKSIYKNNLVSKTL